MKNKILSIKFIFLLSIIFYSCANATNNQILRAVNDHDENIRLHTINASQYGVSYPKTFVLMENRRGVRIEYCLDRNNLQLWISPLAGKSLDYYDRNWSNRDDHTNIFDRILIQGLSLSDFDSCNYDPFHSILYYKNQILHISHIYDQPTVMVWLENGGEIDLKVYGHEVSRTEKAFVINRTDRERNFQFSALIGNGPGAFQHQPFLDKGRSIHARANLTPGQVLFISGELESENILPDILPYQNKSIDVLLKRNEKFVSNDLQYGRFVLKEHPEMQKLLEKNRRVALSFQTFKGFMRTTNKYIYYLYWIRDAGINTSYLANTGWLTPMKDNLVMALKNPSENPIEPHGKFYGQMLAGPITKWQEDGVFFVIWQAYSYWAQTGDDTYIKGVYLEIMKEALHNLERYCYDPKIGLFGRYYKGETPLTDSRDDYFDMANGAPTYSSQVKYNDKIITRSYDLYNILFYNCYRMLASFCSHPDTIQYYDEKANSILTNLKPLYNEYAVDSMPSFGYFLTKDNEIIVSDRHGMKVSTARNALTIPMLQPFSPNKYYKIKKQLLYDMKHESSGVLMKSLMTVLLSLDTQLFDEDEIMEILESLVPQSVRPGKYLPMPYTIPEYVDAEDGNPFHDIRPIVYSSAPWLANITNLGLRRLPFGFAIRPTKHLDSINKFEYRQQLLHIKYETLKDESECTFTMNGSPLNYSWQIPIDSIQTGNNYLLVSSSDVAKENVLIGSTIQLNGYTTVDSKVIFDVNAYGHNELHFKNLTRNLSIIDSTGNNINFVSEKVKAISYLYFEGRGKYQVVMN